VGLVCASTFCDAWYLVVVVASWTLGMWWHVGHLCTWCLRSLLGLLRWTFESCLLLCYYRTLYGVFFLCVCWFGWFAAPFVVWLICCSFCAPFEIGLGWHDLTGSDGMLSPVSSLLSAMIAFL
jgi:hypothetical protein